MSKDLEKVVDRLSKAFNSIDRELDNLKREIEKDKPKIVKVMYMDLVLKVSYIDMFVRKMYVKQWFCSNKNHGKHDSRYIYVTIIPNERFIDDIKKYSTTAVEYYEDVEV